MDKKTMSWIVIGIILFLGTLMIVNKNNQVTGNIIEEEDVKNLHEVELAIEDMYCEACSYAVKAQIEELDGVINANINYKTASGIVRYDADKIDSQTIASASTTYPATVTSDKKL